jgi:hypothetical protein
MQRNYKYYNSGTLGVIGIPTENIKHINGDFTFINGRASRYSWIKTSDLFDSRELAEQSNVAEFN